MEVNDQINAQGGEELRPFKCPVCNGTGLTSKPFGVAGDVEQWLSTSAVHTCRPCNGSGIILVKQPKP